MANHTDLTFITNEGERTLRERFTELLKGARQFDALSGYFYSSGFHAIHPSLEEAEKIRILVGIGMDRETAELAQDPGEQLELRFSHAETKEKFRTQTKEEVETADDTPEVEAGIRKFLQWVQEKKLEIKVYPSRKLHAKLYIMTYREGDRDIGRVVTGSSNFTKAGLQDNLEFNAELKSAADYHYAKDEFEKLWKQAVDVSNDYINTIEKRTWINDAITPYQLYLKCLYEHFKDELSDIDSDVFELAPDDFKRLEYQRQAVLNAKRILLEYGGVFISDVVGLGKTYISVMLAKQLDGRSLVLAPPALLDKANPGSWRNAFLDFNVSADYQSTGNLGELAGDKKRLKKCHNVFIDEAHHFRTDTNATYRNLAAICRGKRVILITATPYNNSPADIFSQIKLFQPAKDSTIPGLPNLEKFFGALQKAHTKLDRRKDPAKYMAVSKANAREIRTRVLKYLMVRRTRKEIESYFANDLAKQGFKFPEVVKPEALYYQLNAQENAVFRDTTEAIGEMLYARYTPMLYYTGDITKQEKQGHENIRLFIKILLIKRLESSFYAFKRTINRFVKHQLVFLKQLKNGYVYTSKSHSYKLFQLLSDEDYDAVDKLVKDDKVRKYSANDFKPDLKAKVERDLATLWEMRRLWQKVKRDPKLLSFVEDLSNNSVSGRPGIVAEVLQKHSKIIVFTESKETANYLARELAKEFSGVVAFSGGASPQKRRNVIDNFDNNAPSPANYYRILVTTEVLSEGVNLHRSNVVINYDIPWNPTRLMQRVGRVNRVDTPHKKIHTFTFFPTEEGDSQMKLETAAKGKIAAFISMLGADAKLLTDDEIIESHELFNRLLSSDTITGERGEPESELKYLQVIKDVRENNPDLFEKIAELPKKARTARKQAEKRGQVITYHKKGKLRKFFITSEEESQELDFMDAAGILKASPETPQEKLPGDFREKQEKNKDKFLQATIGLDDESGASGQNRGNAAQLLKYLRAIGNDTRQLTEEQKEYLQLVLRRLEEMALAKETVSTVLKLIKQAGAQKRLNAQSAVALMKNNIPEELLKDHAVKSAAVTEGPREVILSEYITGD